MLAGLVAPVTASAQTPLATASGGRLGKLVSGPMAGPAEMRGVSIWVQSDAPCSASIEYWVASSPTSRTKSATTDLAQASQFSGHIRLFGLTPGTAYGYQLLLDGVAAGGAQSIRTQSLWQWRTDAPNFTLLAGSCNYGNEPDVDRPGRPYGDRHDIFDVMAAQQPDLMLWLGDNLYYREVDYSSKDGMATRWAYERKQAYVQKLLRTGSHAAIWDDHDYGQNDSNASFVFKDEALALQKRYWANPSYGIPGTPGAFTTFGFADADFFLLDDRWYRDDHKLNDARRVMLGDGQMRWLKNALLTSTGRFKIIAGGSQMLHKGKRGDSWQDYPAERDDFLKFLAESKITGVLFMSGDVHRSELTRIERPGHYALHDMTSSPMTSGVYVDESLRVRDNLVPGTVVMGERNFCRIRFEGTKFDRRMVVSVINADGQTKWTHEITAASLGAEIKPPPPKPAA